jgi:hypothetical protein
MIGRFQQRVEISGRTKGAPIFVLARASRFRFRSASFFDSPWRAVLQADPWPFLACFVDSTKQVATKDYSESAW